MDSFETLILVFHVLIALAIIGLILIQHGKGADMGAGFGSGASSTVFGSGGAGNFLTRLTTGIAIVFFFTSFGFFIFILFCRYFSFRIYFILHNIFSFGLS